MGEGLRGDGLRKDEEDERCNPKAGPETALPFCLHISNSNRQFTDHLTIADK